jgi:hypothetical protein
MAKQPAQGGPGGTGTVYSYAQLKALWLQAAAGTKYATNTWASLMAAIAEAESSGNPAARNGSPCGTNSYATGLWQICWPLNSKYVPSGDPTNAADNAAGAVAILKAQGLGAWETYTNGAYKAFLNDATSPNSSGIDPASSSSTAGALPGASSDCVFGCVPGVPALWGGFSLFTYGQLRGLIGGLLIVAGLPIAFAGLRMLASDMNAAERLAAPVGAVLGPERQQQPEQQQPKQHPIRNAAKDAAEVAAVAAA